MTDVVNWEVVLYQYVAEYDAIVANGFSDVLVKKTKCNNDMIGKKKKNKRRSFDVLLTKLKGIGYVRSLGLCGFKTFFTHGPPVSLGFPWLSPISA